MDLVVRGNTDANNLHLGTAARVSIREKFQSGFIQNVLFDIYDVDSSLVSGVHWGTSSMGSRRGGSVRCGIHIPFPETLKVRHVGVLYRVEFGYVDERDGLRGSSAQW